MKKKKRKTLKRIVFIKKKKKKKKKDLNEWPKELISGAMNSLLETSSSATNPLFDTVLGVTEENFWSSTCESDKQR